MRTLVSRIAARRLLLARRHGVARLFSLPPLRQGAHSDRARAEHNHRRRLWNRGPTGVCWLGHHQHGDSHEDCGKSHILSDATCRARGRRPVTRYAG